MAIIQCPECGKNISDKANSCPGCGYPLERQEENAQSNAETIRDADVKTNRENVKKPQSSSSIISLVATCFVITYPLALILAIIDLKKKDDTKKHIGSLITCFASPIMVMALVLAIKSWVFPIEEKTPIETRTNIVLQDEENNDDNVSKNVDNDKMILNSYQIGDTEIVDEIPSEAFIDEFYESMRGEFGNEFSQKIVDVFRNDIGFVNVEFKGKINDTANYALTADGIDVIMTAWMDEEYLRIFTPNGGGVYYDDGKVILTAQEKQETIISWEDRIVYFIMAQDIIKNNLKFPKSADFPELYSGDVKMQKKGDIVGVQSYVDAQNSFGMTVRSDWIVQFRPLDMSSYSYEILYIKIDDQTAGSFIDLNL